MNATLSELIIREAEKQNLTMRGLARKAHVSHTTVNEIANGQRTPSAKTCRALAAALGIPEEELLVAAGHLKLRGSILPSVADWSDRLSALEEEEQELTIEAMEGVLRMSEGRRPYVAPRQDESD